MHTRSGARARSASLPPPVSPRLVGQAREVSDIFIVPESADSSWSGQGFEQRDEPAVWICNPNGDEARTSSCSSSCEDDKEESGSVNLRLSSGGNCPLALGAVNDDGFVRQEFDG
jgi:hypothetical protein